jgi:hypothetical protein
MNNETALELPADGVEAMSREERREFLATAVHELAATRYEGIERLGKMLHTSPHAVEAWLKPETSKSANNPPAWAVELYVLKRHGPAVRVFERIGGGGRVALAEF